MGLDMWLYDKNNQKVMTWRKINQVRGWLVNHKILEDDDNCIKRVVTVENLKDMISDCKKVLENHSLAESLMPTTSGFFFGNTEYDEYYFEDLQETVNTLEPVLQNADEKRDHFIYEDWW